jgi:gliding motility-associated-like protein
MKKSLYIFLFLSGSYAWAQNPSISPQVINSSGNYSQVGSSGIWITSNVGEPFTETIGSNSVMVTQGFIQPEVISVGGFTMTPLINHLSCTNKNDGGIILEILHPSPYTIVNETFLWKDSTLCPTNDCSSLKDLKAGTYDVKVIITYSNAVGVLKVDTVVPTAPIVVNDPNTPCLVRVFTGITLNNDGTNDVFTIDNIDQFPNNRVLIFNRWGKQLADIKGYDNITKFWPEKDAADKLLPSTYFYVIELGDGSKVFKGWVELMKN